MFQQKKDIENKLSDYGYVSNDNKSAKLEKKRDGKSFIDRYKVNNMIDKTFNAQKSNFETLQNNLNTVMERSFDSVSQRSGGAESLLYKLKQN